MRVTVWGINYAPEPTGIAPFNTGLCDELRAHGHAVTMVTTFPYYPAWEKIPGDRGRLFRTDDCDGVAVHRCWHYVPRRVTALRRMVHEISFGLTSFYRVLRLPAPGVYVVISPPLILGPLAALAGRLKRRPYVFHVQDLQPDAAIGLGMVKRGRFARLLYRMEAMAYRNAAMVSGIAGGMLEAFTKKGVPGSKQRLFPNWIRWYGRNEGLLESETERAERGRAFRRKFGIAGDVFLATYSGNLGRKQGLETLVESAALLAGRTRGRRSGDGPENGEAGIAESAAEVPASGEAPPGAAGERHEGQRQILILIVGEGAMREALEKQTAALGLPNVKLMKLLKEADYHGMLAASDVALILQAPDTGQFFFPSKLLSVLSVGTPVISAADRESELAKAVSAGRFGTNVRPADPAALARVLGELVRRPEQLEAMRKNTLWVRQFSREKVLGDFERDLRQIAGAE